MIMRAPFRRLRRGDQYWPSLILSVPAAIVNEIPGSSGGWPSCTMEPLATRRVARGFCNPI